MEKYSDGNVLVGKKHKLTSRVCLISCTLIFLCTFLIAFLIGYFVNGPCSTIPSVNVDSEKSHQDEYRGDGRYAESDKHHLSMRDEISKSMLEEHLRTFTAAPHQATSTSNCEVIVPAIKRLWSKYLGKDSVDVIPYYVLLSQPTEPGFVQIKKNDGILFTSSKREKSYTDEEKQDHVPPYNAYSANGTVEGDLVYVNYGLMSDFLFLKQKNIDITGKILLMRYGKIFRANKVQLAEHYGAAGVILYSDPADYSLGTTKYPDSWWLPSDGVQRGTVNHLDTDPSSIGFPADGTDIYYNPSKEYLPKVPVLPISFGDAVHLMSNLDGEVAPSKWFGKMNVTYRINASPANQKKYVLSVHMKNYERSKICNVVAKIPGTVEPDRIVMLGNHHDAWVFGGLDPSTGTASLTEIVRVLGIGLKNGWKPRRTILLASWDAEEYGLLGSTEWCEENIQLIKNQVVAYLNVDSAVEGNFTLTAKTSSQLAHNIFKAASKVQDPDYTDGTSILETWSSQLADSTNPGYPKIRTPASGSDFKTFIERFGVPVTDIRYDFDWDVVGRIQSAPTYHSLHDNFDYVKRFVDPDFRYTAAVSKVWLLAALQLADDVILPMNYSNYARSLKNCANKFFSKNKVYLKNHDDEIKYLVKALDRFASVMKEAMKTVEKPFNDDKLLSARQLNDQLMQLERSFISPKNDLSTKHVVYGASKWNLYRGSCFPDLYDHILDIKYHSADASSEIRKDIARITYHIEQATSIFSPKRRSH